VNPVESQVFGIRGSSSVTAPGFKQKGLARFDYEPVILLKHGQASLLHEDQLMGIDDANAVGHAAGASDEEPAVERADRKRSCKSE